MLTGRPPWSDRAKKAGRVLALVKNPNESITVPKNISEECYDFIFNSCLQRDPKRRWTADELVHHPYLKKRLLSVEMSPENNILYSSRHKTEDYIEQNSMYKTHQPNNETTISNIRQTMMPDKPSDESKMNNSKLELKRSISVPQQSIDKIDISSNKLEN